MKKHDITDAQNEMLLIIYEVEDKPSEVIGEWCEENYYQVLGRKSKYGLSRFRGYEDIQSSSEPNLL